MHPAVGLGGANAYESGLTFFAQWNSFIAGTEQYFDRIDSPGDFKRIKGSARSASFSVFRTPSISAGRMT